ncbi:hypothetical protein LPN01_16845 [Sphingomonas sp. A2-49]|uniref:hypothetical protein n=1 Tax=Sphingomonas sp. A2-49 TaxID=1391375 RepID=UPI0021CF04AF|nr:hypothetical protein [Sphingomonas sp. A2-49]MCU6455749.1 hypothetical protein [Sphingomonas sp. A2-49]
MDPPAPFPHRTADALADIAAGRLVGSNAMALRLGGWHLARVDGAPSACDPFQGSPATSPATPLCWTARAVGACDRLRRSIAATDPSAERRFAAALVRGMIQLIVDGAPGADGCRDVALCPAVTLRLHVTAAGIVVLDLHDGPSTG